MALFQKIFRHKKIRYLTSGGIAFVIEYGIFIFLLSLNVHLFVANSISFIIGVLSGFLLHKYWSFAGLHAKSTGIQTITTILLGCINLLLTNILIALLVDYINFPAYLAKVLVILCIVIWNYLLFNKIIFRLTRTTEEISL
ncbi:GtrA family protein [bacterium]|nr:MAG: GtrA family protein [bacterium]